LLRYGGRVRLPEFVHSLRFKLGVGFVLVVASTAVTMGIVVDVRSRSEILCVHDERGARVARQFARSSARDVVLHDDVQLRERLDQLQFEEQVRYATVFDTEGEALATWHVDGVALPPSALAFSGGIVDGPRELDLDGEAMTEFEAPIRAADEAANAAEGPRTVGFIRLGISRHALMRRLADARTQTIWLVVLDLLLGTLAALVALRSAMHPVRKLIRATRALARGSYSEVATLPRTRDEIGVLSRSFRTMAWRLAASQRLLVEANAHLEQRVRARTAELEQALADLQSLDRMKDDFLSNVSHEFKTPLTNIRIAAEVVRDFDDVNAETRRSFLTQTIVETERLTRLVNNLIDLVKIESNEVRWHLTRVDLRVLAEEMAGTLAPLVREKKLTLTIAQSGETPPVVSDPDRVRQVLANLLLNAITFSPIGGSIDVCTRHDGRVVRVFVRDHGVGIESDARIRIFERFKQVGDTLTEKPPGAGLGLPLSKGIIEHLGGEMAVHSRVGAGSTFVFSLPIDGPTDDDLKGHHRRPVVLLDDALAARD
jgi:signal transduction histidine kinase